ncbi:MAG: hypothetical protein JW715_00890 [Sedimentisphaerales bacterium]|nr:hypothetical protein [Sedimentisphaerales bacterium]
MEVVTATGILGLICSSVLIVIDRCITSSTDSVMQMQAFEVARENMEALLSRDSIEETVEYGTSERYPEINWKTVVETFNEPLTASIWLRGICSAEYTDTAGQKQTVELIHWLTDLSSEQLLQIMNQQGQEQLAAQLLETVEEAAEYAGVDGETIEKWVDNGMLTTEDGTFIKDNLDIYKRTNGNPTAEEKNLQIKSKSDLMKNIRQDEVDPKTGLTYEQLEQMDVSEVWDILKNRQK